MYFFLIRIVNSVTVHLESAQRRLYSGELFRGMELKKTVVQLDLEQAATGYNGRRAGQKFIVNLSNTTRNG